MQDQLISFEVAKLAKEKGFDIRSEQYRYNSEGELTLLEGINAPTQSLLQRWLREVHNIDVLITSVNGRKLTRYVSKIYVNKIWMKIVGHSVIYEDTFEKGLQEALKLIK